MNDNRFTGILFSSFDLFHAGHVIMLRQAKDYCNYLVVAIQTDPTIDRPDSKNRPVQEMFERYTQVEACKYVDKILVYSTEADLLNLIKTEPFDVRFLGDDYIDKEFTGKDFCLQNDKEIVYLTRQHDYSTTSLRERIAKG